MKFISLLATALALATVTAATPEPDSVGGMAHPAMSRHPLSLQRRKAMLDDHFHPSHRVEKRGGSKRKCKAKTKKAAAGKTSTSSSAGTGKKAVEGSKNHVASDSQSNKSNDDNDDSDSKTAGQQVASSGSGKGLFGMKFKACGSSGATDANPNGSQSFLNCGIDGSGWNPPDVKLDDLKSISASDAVKQSVFAPCKPYVWAFEGASKAYGIPATMLMSFAMQESTCNPQETGANGENGLMQITSDKCGGAPNGNCKDVWFNINAGAKYFKSQIGECNGNVLEALGRYNGWSRGMTVAKATAARWQGNCYAQNNLDYLYQMLNYWMQGKDGYSAGKYQNLSNC